MIRRLIARVLLQPLVFRASLIARRYERWLFGTFSVHRRGHATDRSRAECIADGLTLSEAMHQVRCFNDAFNKNGVLYWSRAGDVVKAHLCECGAKIVVRTPRGVKARRGIIARDGHDMCRRCWRGLQDRRRADYQSNAA
jgi:hypothetical protein